MMRNMRLDCFLIMATLTGGCAARTPWQPVEPTPGAEERAIVAALNFYLASGVSSGTAGVCLLGERAQPLGDEIRSAVRGAIHPVCQERDYRLYALATRPDGGSEWQVDVRREMPPCGSGGWDCTPGPEFHGLYDVQALYPSSRVVGYRAFILGGKLVGPEAEYGERDRLFRARTGVKQ